MCNVFELQTHVSLFLHYGDLSDSTNLFHIISTVKPHEIYNLGAMSHVAVSIDILLRFWVKFSTNIYKYLYTGVI